MKLFYFLSTFLLATGFQAFSANLSLDLHRFYSNVLSCEPLTLPCLEERGLLRKIGAGLYVIQNKDEELPAEVITGSRMAEFLNLPILLIPDLPGIQGVPVVDAIVFSKVGLPIANLSLKSLRGDTTNGINAIDRHFTVARSAHRRLYNADHLPNQYGFTISDTGVLMPKRLGLPDQRNRRLLLEGVHHLLGFGKQSSRDVWLTVDFLDDPFKVFAIVAGTEGVEPLPFAGTFFEMHDSRQPMPPDRLRRIHLESLIERIKRDASFSEYFFLLNQRGVRVNRDGYSVSDFCESRVLDELPLSTQP